MNRKAEGETWEWGLTTDGLYVVYDANNIGREFAVCRKREDADRIIADHQQAQRLEQAVNALEWIIETQGYGELACAEMRNKARETLRQLRPPAEQPGGTR